MEKILSESFFKRDALIVAPELVGKIIVRTLDDGTRIKLRIDETECYMGEHDTACHASRGRTKRTEILYHEGGCLYVYLCYGVHNLMNVITGEKDNPQGVLIRSCVGFNGPGKLTKKLQIDRSFNDERLDGNKRICFVDDKAKFSLTALKRVGIDYASEEDINRLWRWKINQNIG